ncbi:MAG: fimbrial assembly protein [Gammaproteobacteria bacterium]|nr:fimbrial assembly protein [Gammaproteobacteria bacterium]
MKQQINLYRPIFRKQEKKFSAQAMLQAGGAILAGVAVIYGLMHWQVSGLRDDMQQTEKQWLASTKRLDDAVKQFGPGAKSQVLEDEVTKLERQLTARLRIRELLTHGMFSNTTGYSSYFLAFARQHVSGISLTEFAIVGAGEDMQLQGRTADPAQVPRYLQRLSTESVMAGHEFQVFVMSRPKKDDTTNERAYVDFLFRTGAAKDQGKS